MTAGRSSGVIVRIMIASSIVPPVASYALSHAAVSPLATDLQRCEQSRVLFVVGSGTVGRHARSRRRRRTDVGTATIQPAESRWDPATGQLSAAGGLPAARWVSSSG